MSDTGTKTAIDCIIKFTVLGWIIKKIIILFWDIKILKIYAGKELIEELNLGRWLSAMFKDMPKDYDKKVIFKYRKK